MRLQPKHTGHPTERETLWTAITGKSRSRGRERLHSWLEGFSTNQISLQILYRQDLESLFCIRPLMILATRYDYSTSGGGRTRRRIVRERRGLSRSCLIKDRGSTKSHPKTRGSPEARFLFKPATPDFRPWLGEPPPVFSARCPFQGGSHEEGSATSCPNGEVRR